MAAVSTHPERPRQRTTTIAGSRVDLRTVFRAEFERQRREIDSVDSIVRMLDALREQHGQQGRSRARHRKEPGVRSPPAHRTGQPELLTVVAIAEALDAEVQIGPASARGARREGVQGRLTARAPAPRLGWAGSMSWGIVYDKARDGSVPGASGRVPAEGRSDHPRGPRGGAAGATAAVQRRRQVGGRARVHGRLRRDPRHGSRAPTSAHPSAVCSDGIAIDDGDVTGAPMAMLALNR